MVKISEFNEFADNTFSINNFKKLLSMDNCEKHRKRIQMVNNIINNELTEKQKQCMMMYYIQNMNTIEISKKLNICPSTAWRHIAKAKNKIRSISKYWVTH